MPDGRTVPDEVREEIAIVEDQEVQQQTPVVPEQQAFSVFKRPDQTQPVTDTQTAGETDTATPQDESGQAEGEGTGQTEEQPPQEDQLTPQEKTAYEKLAEDDPALHKVLEMGKESIYQHIQEKDDLEDWQVELIRQRFAKDQPKDVVEYVTKLRMLKDLQQEHGLSDDEIIDWEQAFDEMSVAEVQQYMDGLVQDFIPEGYQLDIRGETDADSEEAASPTEPEDKVEDPLPKNQTEQVEAAGEDKTKEAELTAQAAKAVEQMEKVTAWKEYAKRYPPPQEPQEFIDADKKVPNPNYEAEKQLHQAALVEYRKAFDQFWQEKYLPRVKAEQAFIKDNPKPSEKLPDGSDNPEYAAWAQKLNEFSETFDQGSVADNDIFGKKGEILLEQARQAGLDYLFTHYTNSDLSTTFKAIFGTHDLYRAGNVNWVESDSDTDSSGKPLNVLGFKEIVGWTSGKEKITENKRRWLLLCALMCRQFKGSKLEKLNPENWLTPDALQEHKIKEHMLLFYEECIKFGKKSVDAALNKAFDDPTLKSTGLNIRKPAQKLQVTAELMAHIQMMGNHLDHVQNFFGG